MFVKLFAAIVVIVAVFIAYAMRLPDSFTVTRSVTMAASPDKIFGHVNTLKQWNDWSPWAKLDPNAKTTFTGPESGVDSSMSWISEQGNVGVGTMTIIENHPNESVKFRLDFQKPFPGTSAAEFSFKPEGDHTVVTWSMSGTRNIIAKIMGLIMNCEEMVGGQFEKGLSSLRAIVEAK